MNEPSSGHQGTFPGPALGYADKHNAMQRHVLLAANPDPAIVPDERRRVTPLGVSPAKADKRMTAHTPTRRLRHRTCNLSMSRCDLDFFSRVFLARTGARI